MSNPFTYAELHTQDPAAARTFYRQLFDWRMADHPHPTGTYTEIDPGEGFPAGLLRAAAQAGGSRWLPYVKVTDLAASTARALSLGATIVQDGVEVAGQGRFSVLLDPTGAVLGLWEPVPA